MNNNELLKNFLLTHLNERLIDYSARRKKVEASSCGRMFFPQKTVIKNDKLYYKTFNKLLAAEDLLKIMKDYEKENSDEILKISMNEHGKWMGSTHCRFCRKNLGNGSGGVAIKNSNRTISFSLTGGADHYLKEHKIKLSLINYLFENKEKNIKAHINFVGSNQDIIKIEEFIERLSIENKAKNSLKF